MTVSGTPVRLPRAVLYARVSTSDQRADLQLDGLRQLAESRRWNVIGEFVDVGVSGSKDRRPQLDAMLFEVRRGRVDVMASWKLDRLARSLRHLIHLVDELRVANVDLISVSDAIDTASPSGRFALHVLGACSELERELIRERTVEGLRAARKRGKHLGRPKVRFDVDEAVRLRLAGRSFANIAMALGVSVGTLHRAIKSALQESPSADASAVP